MDISTVSIPKERKATSRIQRQEALGSFKTGARRLGVTGMWLVGSMARGEDGDMSDVDVVVEGRFNLWDLYRFRDQVYLESWVIINIGLDCARNPKVKII